MKIYIIDDCIFQESGENITDVFVKTTPPELTGHSLTELCRLWEEQYCYGSIEDRRHREARWEPYYSMIYRSQLGQPFQVSAEPDPAVQVLLEQKLLTPDTSVLEIGCGTGALALSLAPYCRDLTAMDANETAVKVLRQRCVQAKIDNVSPVCASWNEAYPTGHYDLVISAMCPAVCNREGLLAMEAAGTTRVLITVMRGSCDKYRSQIMKELALKPEGMITEYGMYLDVLRAMGRQPKLWTKSVHSVRTTDLNTLLETFPIYLEIFGIDRQRSEAYLTDFFARNQDGGVLHDETQMNTALLLWQRDNTTEGK